MCHTLLQDPAFFLLLLRIDEELASQARALGCSCGGVLHSARYPRKPRGCPAQIREHYGWRLSFCCARCDRRTTPASVRFLGRRVYLGVVLTLVSSTGTATMQHLSQQLRVSVRTLNRWRAWWHHDFVRTALWQSMRARLSTPVSIAQLPHSLLERFEADDPVQQRVLLLHFLSPLSTRAVSE